MNTNKRKRERGKEGEICGDGMRYLGRVGNMAFVKYYILMES